MPRPFKLALIQMYVAPGEGEKNLRHALDLTAQAAAAGAEVILLPEALPFGWMDPAGMEQAQAIPSGEPCRHLCSAAQRHGIYLCAGVVEKCDNQIFNAAVLLAPSGDILLHHRKINELAMAHHCYALGDRLGVADTPLGRFGLMVCADGFAPGQAISRSLGFMGAQVILSPCAWAVPPEHDNARTPYGGLWMENYGPVCREFNLWIAGCSNVGPIRSGAWAGHKCIGCSLVVGPEGREVTKGSYGENAEEILYLELEPRAVRRPPGDV